ncbi:ectopic P granules protein 5 homolog, partial [Uloborus diversus]|uniref:ectopic P granules protein 5 homolog n=1 Tax=Uloborus diversus TaxID=327109 RepID=UPI002409BCF3
VSHIWKTLDQSFASWLHPVVEGAHLSFPWSDNQINEAEFMFKIFTMCLKYSHEQLLINHNCEKYILSYLWGHYVQSYVSHGYRHYSISLCHTELLKLPWHQFHPDAEDIEGMCKVLQSDLKESKEFLAKISLEIPWLDVMSYVSSTKPPEYVGKTLGTLAKLLIISGWDTSTKKKKFQQNDFKELETLPWYFLHLDDVEGLLSLFFSGPDIAKILLGVSQNAHQILLFQFLKFLCCMSANSSSEGCCTPKRLLYLHKYTSSLSVCISAKKELFLKNSDNFKTMLPSLLKDIEVVVSKGVKSDEIVTNALPLVREVIGFLNSIAEPTLEKVATDSVVSWLTSNHRSPLLLPCLKSSCCCLNTMANMVIICECCIESRFADSQDAVEASSIFQLISSYFQVPYGHCDEFVQVCVQKRAFLAMYCYVLQKRSNMTSTESKKQLVWSLVDWIRRARVSENCEAKSLLLWDKILELCIILTSEDEVQSVQKVLLSFCNELNAFSEDRVNTGVLGAIGFGRHSELSVNFRFMCCAMVAYLLLQIPDNAPIRLEAMASGYLTPEDSGSQKRSPKLPQPSQAALKALEKLNALLDKKPYSALRCQVNDAISCIRDPKNSFVESRQFLKRFALLAFPKDNFLHALS